MLGVLLRVIIKHIIVIVQLLVRGPVPNLNSKNKARLALNLVCLSSAEAQLASQSARVALLEKQAGCRV